MRYKIFAISLLCVFCSFNTLAESSNDYEKALSSYNSQQYDEAFIHLKNSLQNDVDHLAAKILMGKILLIQGYLSAAETEFYEALQQGADINLIAEPLGNALLFQNKYADILTLNYTEKLAGEDKVQWLQIRASACMRLQKLDCATEAYQNSLAITPEHQMSLNGLASIAIFSNKLDSAEGYISRALNISELDPTTWRLKGELAKSQGKLEQAIDDLQQSLKLKSDDPVTLRKLADIYLESNDFESARAFVEEIIEKTPNDPLAILLNSWIESRDKSKLLTNERLQKLNEIMASLSPEFIAAQPELLYISGLTAFFHGNAEQATSNFAKYLYKNPSDMKAVMLLARTYLMTQQDKQALLLLEKHQDTLVENLDSALMLGELFIKLNRAFKAQDLTDVLDKTYQGHPRLELFKIKLMMVRGKQQEALKILDNSFNKNKTNATFLFTYSMLKLQAKKPEEALQGAQALLELYPNEAEFLNLKAGILIRMEKLDEAINTIEMALKANPKLFPAKFNLASIYSRKKEIERSNEIIESLLVVSPKHSQTLLLKAHNLTIQSKTQEAIDLYRDIILINPRNQYAQSQLAELYYSQGKFDQTLYQLNRLLADNFDNSEYLLLKAQALSQQNKRDELIDILRIITQFDDLSVETLISLSRLQRNIEQYDAAIHSLERAENLTTNNTFIILDKVKLLITKQDFEQAKIILNSIRTQNQNNPNFWFVEALYVNSKEGSLNASDYLHQALKLSPNFHQALIVLYEMDIQGIQSANFVLEAEKVLQASPNNVLAKNILAQYHYIQQNFARSIELYEELLQAEELINRAEVLNKLAVMNIESDLDKSADYIKQAMKLNTNSARILDTYGWVLILQNRHEEGLDILRRAFARDSNDPEIRYHLGYSLIKLDRLEEAKSELNKAVNVKRPFYNRVKAQALLEQIE
ncbi:XrtA/PEP-CTERM system TPR-repeat protein PrsT [Paraglaciecola sp. L3A3]|uniref:XrtA/PEP-CTERM system TPR-repeat protein PrsT n=1 Tax=Paraglaciecola sp. L3A3 TaxID=2686358 RepID=UPI00131B6FCB|nr:XrtA/PEP-CTERM system TPR-repeat protein PrsT [Paraglaciecola sp. L3A3]